MLLALPEAGRCEAWSVQPVIQAGVGADDNLRLSQEGDDTVYSGSAFAGMAAQRLTDTVQVRAGASVGYTAYGGDDAPDDEDVQILQLDSLFNRERAALRLGGEFRRDTTLAEAAPVQEETDPGADLDVGLVEQSIRRHRLLLNGSFERALTERLDGRVGYDLTRMDFASGETVGLHDSWTHRVDARGLYRTSERSRVGLGVQALVFRSAASEQDLDSVSLIGTADHRLSERSAISALAGVWRARGRDGGDDEADETGLVAQLTGRTRGERWSGSVTAEHSLRPSGEGVLREADQVIARAGLDLSPRLRLKFGARAFETRAAFSADELPDRRYAELEPSLVWRLTEAWSLSGLYQYRRSDTEGEPDAADSNSVALLLEYRPPVEVGL